MNMVDQQEESHLKIGVVGCGTIGSGIAKALHNNLHPRSTLSGVYDIDVNKSNSLCQELSIPTLRKETFEDLISLSDLVVEAVNAPNTHELIAQIISSGKDVLVMSVGKLLANLYLFDLAKEKNTKILIPSGAVAGIDALKAASYVGIDTITLTTYKPPRGLKGAPYIESQQINLDSITKETQIFEGTVNEAVTAFPQNINVAATIALASDTINKLRIRIITSPEFTHNRHEIHATGPFGEITTTTKNFPSPDNPKTSYLAALSGIAAIKTFCDGIKIGT